MKYQEAETIINAQITSTNLGTNTTSTMKIIKKLGINKEIATSLVLKFDTYDAKTLNKIICKLILTQF
jgi:hypothetical protein